MNENHIDIMCEALEAKKAELEKLEKELSEQYKDLHEWQKIVLKQEKKIKEEKQEFIKNKGILTHEQLIKIFRDILDNDYYEIIKDGRQRTESRIYTREYQEKATIVSHYLNTCIDAIRDRINDLFK